MTVHPPWTAALNSSEHNLILFGLVATALALAATLVDLALGIVLWASFDIGGAQWQFVEYSPVFGRFAWALGIDGVFRTASLTANAVVSIAAGSYVALVVVFLLGYSPSGTGWRPGPLAQLTWSIRYMDWCVTVPLLVVELLAVSSLTERATRQVRRAGIALALVMIVSGYLGGIVIDDGRDFTALAVAGGVGAACFTGLYAIVLVTLARSTPRLPGSARPAYQAAVVLLLMIWFAYPAVYGLQGITAGGAWAGSGQLALCAADTIAKIGFGTLIHRTAVLRSRAEEDSNPSLARPRLPEADAIWVDQDDTLDARG